MISASEAKRRTDKTISDESTSEMQSISQLILKSIGDGQYMTTYYRSISNITKEALIKNGYRIEITEDPRDYDTIVKIYW